MVGLCNFSLFLVAAWPTLAHVPRQSQGNFVGSRQSSEQAKGKGEPGPCTAGEMGHSQDCTCLFREQCCQQAQVESHFQALPGLQVLERGQGFLGQGLGDSILSVTKTGPLKEK